MNFIKTINNRDDRKQALFEFNGDYYFYSYVNNGFACETMVFPADADGNITDYMELAFEHNYVSSEEMMERLLKILKERYKGVTNNEVIHKCAKESS